MSCRDFVNFFVISLDGQTTYTQQCLLNQASPVKKKYLYHQDLDHFDCCFPCLGNCLGSLEFHLCHRLHHPPHKYQVQSFHWNLQDQYETKVCRYLHMTLLHCLEP
jgi:hypothetical protein